MRAENVFHLVVMVIAIAACFGLVWWLIDFCRTPEPFNRVLKGIVAVVAVLFLCNLILQLAGISTGVWQPLRL